MHAVLRPRVRVEPKAGDQHAGGDQEEKRDPSGEQAKHRKSRRRCLRRHDRRQGDHQDRDEVRRRQRDPVGFQCRRAWRRLLHLGEERLPLPLETSGFGKLLCGRPTSLVNAECGRLLSCM